MIHHIQAYPSSLHSALLPSGVLPILPVNEEGNSVFEIPVTVFDEPVEILAETTAMSRPHEVEYTLTFSSESISSAEGTDLPNGIIWAAVVILAAAAAVCLVKKRKKES